MKVRYGNSKATISYGGIHEVDGTPVQTLDSGAEYIVRMRVEFDQPVDKPVFACTIKDARGTEIAGTNTLYEEIDTGNYDAGCSAVTVEFRQRFRAQSGKLSAVSGLRFPVRG